MDTQRLLSKDQVGSKHYNTIVNVNQTSPRPENAKPSRIVAIDLLRGLIMVLESIDHARIFLMFYGEHETWYILPHYDSWVPFILRFLTHLCAPGFAFLAGVGVVFFSASRKRLGWSDERLMKHFFIRGFLLVLINQIQTIFWASKLNGKYFATTVLFSLGVNFFLGAVISLLSDHLHEWAVSWFSRRYTGVDSVTSRKDCERKADNLRIVILTGFAIFLAALVVALTPLPAPDGITDDSWLWYLIFLPGPSKYFFAIYPPLDWLSLTIYGVAFGYLMLKLKYNNRQNALLNFKFFAFLMMAFITIRSIGKFGNTGRTLLPPAPEGTFLDNPFLASPMTFLNTIKYPPDLAFITLFIGLNHLCLGLFYLVPTEASAWKWLSEGPLLDYGRSALFFYIVHFYLYAILAEAIKILLPSTVDDSGRLNLGWGAASIVWLFGLAILWVMCRWYGRFKASKGPDSVWRFF